MKTLILAVVVTICAQSVNANFDATQLNIAGIMKGLECQREQFEFAMAEKRLITRFSEIHDDVHKDLVPLQDLYTQLSSEVDNFASGHYTLPEVKEFLDSFPSANDVAEAHLDILNSGFALLLDIIIDFIDEKNVTCVQNDTSEGCRRHLNTRRCEMLAVLEDLEQKDRVAIKLLQDIESGGESLVDAAEDFNSKLVEGPAEGELDAKTGTFFIQFQIGKNMVQSSLDQLANIYGDMNFEKLDTTVRFSDEL